MWGEEEGENNGDDDGDDDNENISGMCRRPPSQLLWVCVISVMDDGIPLFHSSPKGPQVLLIMNQKQ